MAAGAPLVTSTATALREVAGGHAFLIDPLSVDSITHGLRAALDEAHAARAARVAKGRAWAGGFTWQGATREHVRIFERFL